MLNNNSIYYIIIYNYNLLLLLAHQGCPPNSELIAPSSHYSKDCSVCITSSHVVVPLGRSYVSHSALSPQNRNCVLSISARSKVYLHLMIFPFPRFWNILYICYCLSLLQETIPNVLPTKLGQPLPTYTLSGPPCTFPLKHLALVINE